MNFWLFGGPGWPINNQTRPILLSSYPLTYINGGGGGGINLHIKYGSNLIKDFLSYRVNDEMQKRRRNDDKTIVSPPPPPEYIRTGDAITKEYQIRQTNLFHIASYTSRNINKT